MIEYLMMDQNYGDVLKSVPVVWPSEPKPKKPVEKVVAVEQVPNVIIVA